MSEAPGRFIAGAILDPRKRGQMISHMTRPHATLAAFTFASSIVACSDDPIVPPPPEPASIEIVTDSIGLYPGEVFAVEATVTDSSGQLLTDAVLIWTSSDEDVVSVDSSGILTAVGQGLAEVTASAGAHLYASALVRVTQFTRISGIASDFCALDIDGAAWCRGRNYGGVLGSESSYEHEFRRVAGFSFDDIAVGYKHACGISNGATYCWGDDEDGQLGRGNDAETESPEPVVGGEQFISLTAGYEHICALDADDAAWCWGRPWEGQLGRGENPDRYTPGRVFGEHTWMLLDAGLDETCGVATDGVTYCWGQLSRDSVPNPAEGMPAEADAVSGDAWLTCVGAGAQVSCRGAEDLAGRGFTSVETLPGAVVAVSSYFEHACAIIEGGRLYCWGPDAAEFLGNGTTAGSSEPVAVLAEERFAEVLSMAVRACGLTRQGALHCWGADVWSPTREPSATPVRIGAPMP